MKSALSQFFLAFTSVLVVAGTAQAEVRSEMKLFSDSFVSSAFESSQKTNYQFFGARLKNDDPKKEDVLQMDLSGGVAFGARLLNYMNFAELNGQFKVGDDQRFSVGRKKLDWNDLDARWNLGVWEPVFKWNPLSPQRQGLTGMFWELERPNYQLALFASGIYLPDEGPSFEIENGEFVNGNPWFRRPPDSIHIFNATTKIDYQMQKPDEAQVVFQRSFGGKFRLGDANGLSLQLSYINKPDNQLALGYDGYLDIPRDRGIVYLKPQTYYHSLTGGDLTYRFYNFKMGFSTIYDRPSQDKIFDAQWTRPVFRDAVLYGSFIEAHYKNLKLYYQRLDIAGGDVTEEGELASKDRRPLMTPYAFRQANEVGVAGQLVFPKFRKLIGGVSYTRSDRNDFSLVKFNARFKFSSLWAVYSEMQLIDAGPLTKDNQNEIAQFVNNDRFLVGASYVF